MEIKCIWEHNGNDTLLYAGNFIGAFSRGETKEIALSKMEDEVKVYLRWKGGVQADLQELNRTDSYEITVSQENFLKNPVIVGSYDEEWSLRKVLRRFLWHDRIHAKAMYRMAVTTFGEGSVPDVFRFEK